MTIQEILNRIRLNFGIIQKVGFRIDESALTVRVDNLTFRSDYSQNSLNFLRGKVWDWVIREIGNNDLVTDLTNGYNLFHVTFNEQTGILTFNIDDHSYEIPSVNKVKLLSEYLFTEIQKLN